MGCFNSKDSLKSQLLEYNNITDEEFICNLKSKLEIIDIPNGFNCLLYFILTIKSLKLCPINNFKLVASNYRESRFESIKKAILEYREKEAIFKLVNKIIIENNNCNLFNLETKNQFMLIINYLYNHPKYIEFCYRRMS